MGEVRKIYKIWIRILNDYLVHCNRNMLEIKEKHIQINFPWMSHIFLFIQPITRWNGQLTLKTKLKFIAYITKGKQCVAEWLWNNKSVQYLNKTKSKNSSWIKFDYLSFLIFSLLEIQLRILSLFRGNTLIILHMWTFQKIPMKPRKR